MDIFTLIFTDYTLRIVSIGSMLLGIIAGILGSFAVVRKESLLGDAISHAALPGIAVVYLITQTKNTEVLLFGALLSGVLATFLILSIEKYSRIKFDSSLALVLSVFFGAGMVLLTYIQKMPDANQAGLESFIYGQASTLLKRDINLMLIVGGILVFLIVLFWKEFKLISFDSQYAEILGFSSKKITILLSTMIVISIVIGLQSVGVILMSAMLTAPAVAARQWTNKLSKMVVLSGFFGGISGIIGTLISSMVSNLPTGPTIVLTISIIVILSLAFAPNRGLVWKRIKEKESRRNIDKNQLLFNIYELALNHENIYHSHSIDTIKPDTNRDRESTNILIGRLSGLEDDGLIKRDYFDHWHITEDGISYVENNLLKEGY